MNASSTMVDAHMNVSTPWAHLPVFACQDTKLAQIKGTVSVSA